MSRRTRAIVLVMGAGLAAAGGAALVAGYGSNVAGGYGPLRPVVVASASLGAGTRIGPEQVDRVFERRRVPVRFVPSGALAEPESALGLLTRGPIPAGSYVLAAQLGPPPHRQRPDLAGGRRPVEITVSGADALLSLGNLAGARVDVVVTTEPSGPGSGRTYVAAPRVPLLALGPGEDGPGPGGTAAATLGLTRPEALRLIAAESFARKLTLLPRR